MRQFINNQDLSKRTALLRVRQLEPLAELTIYESSALNPPIIKYISIDSILSDTQLENLFNTAETTEESNYFASDAIDRQQLKAEYQATIDQLQNIENAQSPTNAQVVAAVKYLAKTIRLMLKLLARLIT